MDEIGKINRLPIACYLSPVLFSGSKKLLTGLIVWVVSVMILPHTDTMAQDQGQQTYMAHCAQCHHPQRIGEMGPPLLPLFLKHYSQERFNMVVQKGLPATQMPSFPHLNEDMLTKLYRFLNQSVDVNWQLADILASRFHEPAAEKVLGLKNIHDLTAVVERGAGQVWVMEKESVLDRFSFKNIHGGIKFAPDGSRFFVPARDGWIGMYDLRKGQFTEKIRACVYLRNIALDREGNHLLVASWLPRQILILDTQTFEVIKSFPIQGNISAIYELASRDQAIFTFRDKPVLGILNTKSLEITYQSLTEPLEDFFIDPLEQFIIGTSRHGKLLTVWDLKLKKSVFEHTLEGMPHLFSAAIWHQGDHFYFATPHIQQPYLSVWKMYDWGFIKKIPVRGDGFFVRTHQATPYLWADNGTDELILIDKRDFSITKRQPMPGKRLMHTEFSGDGSLAYVSISEPQGALLMYDSATLKLKNTLAANAPIGKYNFVHKVPRYQLSQLGKEVFMAKCWGCHHPTQKAFGPSFQWIIQNRSPNWIRAQIMNPEKVSPHLGYQRNAMPKLKVSPEEMDTLISFMESLQLEAHDAANH